MQIYWNKRKVLLKEKGQLPQDQNGRYFIVLGHQNGGRDVLRKHYDYKLNCSLLLCRKNWAHNRFECCLTFKNIMHESLYNCVVLNLLAPECLCLNRLTKTLTEKKTFFNVLHICIH